MNRDADVRPFRPNLPSLWVHPISLGFEITDFGERQLHGPFIAVAPHRDVAPRRAAHRHLPAARGDDLLAEHRTTTQIGPQQTAPLIRQRPAVCAEQRESNAVADEPQEAFARRR